jgi:NAD(P)-dependent dehydrogenase (short-subunit alcohol dehydrogenase family)
MDLTNKTIVITGANAGIGLATAKQLAGMGALIIMICRDWSRGSKAREEIAKSSVDQGPRLYIADLADQVSIHKVSQQLHSDLGQIDVLVNNAGAIFDRRELTPDGIEKTFAVNHLGPFLLTNLLLDLMKGSREGRIVNITSGSHNGKLDFKNLQGELKYNFFDAYNRSKLCNILFTYELARLVKELDLTVNCLDPGPTVTSFGDNMKGVPGLFPPFMKRIPLLFGTPEKAAQTYVYAITSPELNGVSGKFFHHSKEGRTKPITYNTNVAENLWRISESLTRPLLHSVQSTR